MPEAKSIVNTRVLGFRGAKHISVYGVFCSESLKKSGNTNYLTIFGHYGTEKKATRVTAATTTTTPTPTTATATATATTPATTPATTIKATIKTTIKTSKFIIRVLPAGP